MTQANRAKTAKSRTSPLGAHPFTLDRNAAAFTRGCLAPFLAKAEKAIPFANAGCKRDGSILKVILARTHAATGTTTRAALAWAEEVTNVSTTHASDEAYAAAEAFANNVVDPTITIAAMNAFKMLGAPFRLPVSAND